MTDCGFQSLLPPPAQTPIERESVLFVQMKREERALFETCFKPEEGVFVAMPTGTVVDVGHWMSNARVWVLAARDELVLLAAGLRPFVQRTPYSHINRSLYNPVTAELVLAPAKGLKVKQLRISALDGYRILSQVYAKE